MTNDERENARLECLHMTTYACGEEAPFTKVLEIANKYYEFVCGKKPGLKIVEDAS